jgi:GTP-binding protein Era
MTFGETRPVTLIRALIFVEKDNHRKIVIGRHGSLLKQVGIEARREIEEHLGHKVYLELHVKVRERWRDSEDVLDLIEGQKGYVPLLDPARC